MAIALGEALAMIPKQEGFAVQQWGALGSAIALDLHGFEQQAQAKVAAVVISLSEEFKRKGAIRAARAAPQKRPRIYRDEPMVSARNLEDIEKIETQEWLARDAKRRGDSAQAKKHFDRAADIREAIGADIVARRDNAWADKALRETAQLEQLRGEVVDLQQENGRARGLRIKTRDGLLAMFPCRELNEAQRERSQILLKAGMEYRAIYDASKQELGSSIAALGNPRKGASDSMAERVSLNKDRLAKLDGAVVADQQNGRGITALRQIAGEGRTLAFLAASGKNKDLYSKALKRALGVIARELRIERTAPTLYTAQQSTS